MPAEVKPSQESGYIMNKPRAAWIDSVKGLTISLVVLHHVISGVRENMGIPAEVWHWYGISGAVRMPLFFMVAGFFAYKSITSPLKGFVDSKIIYFLYFYVLWSVITISVRGFFAGDSYYTILERVLVIFWSPGFTIWFLYALLISFLILRLSKRVPPEFQIAVFSVVSSFLIYSYPDTTNILFRTLKIYPFFLIGVYSSLWIREYASSSDPKKVFAWMSFFAFVYFCIGLRGSLDAVSFYILAFVSAMAILCLMYSVRDTVIGKGFSFVGKNSLYVYLMHFVPAAGFRELAVRIGFDDRTFIVIFGTIFSVLLPLVVYFCLRNTWLGFLFARPIFLKLTK